MVFVGFRAPAAVLQWLFGKCRAWMKSCGLVEVVCLVERSKKFAITCVAAQHSPTWCRSSLPARFLGQRDRDRLDNLHNLSYIRHSLLLYGPWCNYSA
jgi:hypothetical protein